MGYSESSLDCDDEKASVSHATEICGNEIDDDCNGLIDGAMQILQVWIGI